MMVNDQEFRRLQRIYEGRADFSKGLQPLPTECLRHELQVIIAQSRGVFFATEGSTDEAVIGANIVYEKARQELALLEANNYAMFWSRLQEEALQSCLNAGWTRVGVMLIALGARLSDVGSDQWLALAISKSFRPIISADILFFAKTTGLSTEPCPLICGSKLDLQDRIRGVYWCSNCRRFLWSMKLKEASECGEVVFFSGLADSVSHWRRLLVTLTGDDLRHIRWVLSSKKKSEVWCHEIVNQ
jgi:hypothetical protein